MELERFKSALSLTLWVAGPAAAVAIVAGVVAIRARRLPVAVTAEAVGHVLGVTLLFWVTSYIVPGFKKLFEDFDTALPDGAVAVIALGDLAANLGIGLLVLLLMAVVGDVGVYYRLRRDPATRVAANLWSGTITAVLVAACVAAVAGFAFPFMELVDEPG